jgi:hypothetical protein
MRNAAPLQVESNAVRAEKIRKAAVHHECQQSLVFSWGIRWGYCPWTDNPAKGVKRLRERPRQRLVTEGECHRLSISDLFVYWCRSKGRAIL